MLRSFFLTRSTAREEIVILPSDVLYCSRVCNAIHLLINFLTFIIHIPKTLVDSKIL